MPKTDFTLPKDAVSLAEAAIKRGCSRAWVSALALRGKIQRYEIGGKVFVSLSEVVNYDASDKGGRPVTTGAGERNNKPNKTKYDRVHSEQKLGVDKLVDKVKSKKRKAA